LRKKGLKGIVIATDTFRPLVMAQAKARKLEPHLIVVKHPVGGLNAEELEDRIEAAFTGLKQQMQG
jgi:hypothetical protein